MGQLSQLRSRDRGLNSSGNDSSRDALSARIKVICRTRGCYLQLKLCNQVATAQASEAAAEAAMLAEENQALKDQLARERRSLDNNAMEEVRELINGSFEGMTVNTL